jgi:hypothetical protein
MCLQFDGKFCQQKEGLAVGKSLSPMLSDMFTEHFEEIALDTEHHKPTSMTFSWFCHKDQQDGSNFFMT